MRLSAKNDYDDFVSGVKCVKSRIFPLIPARNVRKIKDFSTFPQNKKLK